MRILLSPRFSKQLKRLHPSEKKVLDRQISKVAESPTIGDPKVGDLEGVYIYKFKIKDQLWLLAYELESKSSLTLLAMGPHENFYRDLKR
jgi:mRNA-degrading endonuclease RelE of RelBE toxin-antitoxin system